MADQDKIIVDEQGRARYFQFERREPAGAGTAMAADAGPGLTPQESARNFLVANAATLGLSPESVDTNLALNADVSPSPEGQALRFESEKSMMDTTTVTYVQTMFGLPIHEAGISVTTQGADNAVAAASSTLQYDIEAAMPDAGLVPLTPSGADATNGAYDDKVRKALGANGKKARINRTGMMVYRYDAARRLESHPYDKHDNGFGGEPPTLPLAAVPASIKDGTHYVVIDVLFTLAVRTWGTLNWRAFIEVETGAVLYLRALVDGATALVFDRDPITKTGNAANLPSATAATLNLLRDAVTLTNLSAPVGGTQSLKGNFVRLFDNSPPVVVAPTRITPFDFNYVSRTNDFAAANAYYHCNRFFQMVGDMGFNVASYFDGTAFPVPIDHRGLGNVINANCPGDALGDGIGQVNFALAHTGDIANPISIGADWRVVIHEIGGHGILWDHVNSPNFGFAHSAGDGMAAIINDPGSAAPDRFVTFPWVNIGRRHDRPVNGWGWGGANDVGGYSSEQILATTHFRIYRSLGGDAGSLVQKRFASRTMVYLILRTVGQLTPATNPPTPLAWEGQLETADLGVWNSTNPPGTFAGGAYHKVIRWAFEKQGLFRAPNAPATVAGVPPAVDVFIDDGRHGEYQFQPNHWSCTDIWNRRTIGAGGGVHEEPVVGQTNHAYVRIKNRGTQVAKSVIVKGFHCLPGVGLTFPTDWVPMTTAQLAAPDLAAGDMAGKVIGPFKWKPSQVGHECMFFSVSARGDAGNIDGRVVGPIPEWRLVPHDNNIGQRNVHPVVAVKVKDGLKVDLAKLPFWIRNHGRDPVVVTTQVKLPDWLDRLGWAFDIRPPSPQKLVVEPGTTTKVALAATKQGTPFSAKDLAAQRDLSIVVTVLQDGVAVGGMTFQVTAPANS
jgi:zinc metalloprotease ZmpB